MGGGPAGLAYASSNHALYVADVGSGAVSAINGGGTVTATISDGFYPTFTAYDRSDRQVIVFDTSGNFTAINTSSNQVVRSFNAQNNSAPIAMVIDPSNGRLYTVTDYIIAGLGKGPGDVYWYNPNTGHFLGFIGLGPNASGDGIGYDPANGEILVGVRDLSAATGSIVAIDDFTDAVVAVTSVGNNDPTSFTYDPVTTQMYVTLYDNATIAVYDSGSNTITGWLAVGSLPTSVAYDPVDQAMYVADSGSNELTVLDAATGDLVSTIATGSTPFFVAYDPAMDRVCASDFGSGTLSCFGSQEFTPALTTSASGAPFWLAYDPAQNVMYVSGGADNISVLNGTTGLTAGMVDVGNASAGIAYDPANGEVYVATNSIGCAVCGLLGSVVVFNASTDAIVTPGIPVGSNAAGVAYDPANHDIYVADEGAGNVSVIRTATNTLGTTLAVGQEPYGLAYDPIGQSLYVSNLFSGNISVINSSLDAVVQSVSVGGLPTVMTYDPNTHDMYIARPGDSDLAVVNAKTNAYLGPVAPFAGQPFAVQYDPFNHFLFASGPGVVWIVTSSGAAVASVVVGQGAAGLAFDSARNEMFAASSISATVTMIDA